MKNEIVPTPCKEEVEKYLNIWNSLPDYVAQESALNKLFFGDFKYNDNLENILIKCSVLNDFYSTDLYNKELLKRSSELLKREHYILKQPIIDLHFEDITELNPLPPTPFDAS